MRYFNNKPIELLAPAGNFEIFQEVVKTKCDAIYFGGKSLNMRMIRKGFNFSDEELEKAIKLAKENDKKTYITVNNLIDFEEIDKAKKYLTKLSQIKPDGLIVQDFSILEIIKELNLPLEVHSSVMMNVHNIPMIEALKKHNVSRVVLSREATLEDVRRIKNQTGMEIEYFTHGDMCIAHGAQCYYSSILFGMNSNRGKCLKPCRWWYSNCQDSQEKDFPLAVKDLCMYPYLLEMINAGVTSFKLEGRMRDKEFITKLINYYGDALDRFIEDPVGYDRYKDYDNIYNSRKRDLSTGYAFGKPGSKNINSRNEGTGKIFSTGKMFSTPTKEKSIDPETTLKLKSIIKTTKETINETLKNITNETANNNLTNKPKISIKVNNIKQAVSAVESNVDRIYITGDCLKPDKPFTIDNIKSLKDLIEKKNLLTEIYVGTPRMMAEKHFELYNVWLKKLKPYIDGILVGNLGGVEAFKDLGLPIVGDYSLNVFNYYAALFYKKEGVSTVTPSIETNAKNLIHLLDKINFAEVVVHGRIPVMYFEHDFYEVYNQSEDEVLKLYNEAGEFEIYKDQHERTHMMTRNTYSLLPVLNELLEHNVSYVRIEGQLETPENIKMIVSEVKNIINKEILNTDNIDLSKCTYGAFQFC